ncbi:elongator complex protein 5 [Geosmithia morbida]|uniref:Elongator complex protein 5 n=1 Tax=Geosmithia morbida TaxID=1094350 RepID=A0A9P5D3R8_9HYPO|nr:elongator complex protein 5 [Geosmithia morbida]KAF4120784.1 elongator complex protein 5 [Geosmithia morbida]
MAPANVHSRSHSLLLLQKLLSLRDGASPLTLILDNLEQKARPILSEFITRAKISKSKVIFLSFETLKKPTDVDVFVKAAGRDVRKVHAELMLHYPPFDPATPLSKTAPRAVVVIDSLNTLASWAPQSLSMFLTSIITPVVSLVSVYHDDVPVVLPYSWNEYEPHPFTVLCHLATAVLRLSNLEQEIDRQRARNRSLVEPEWGLKEDREGILIGLRQAGDKEARGVAVIEMELRRRSGRAVSERFILYATAGITHTSSNKPAAAAASTGKVVLLTDHPMFAAPTAGGGGENGQGEEEPESTFNLGLTDKQRKDRDGIVLPYFDAQTDIGAGEGGRILYDMGREDDFDDEEDEI